MAPVAGRYYAAARRRQRRSPIVADTGGTSYDVSLVRERPHPLDPRDLARPALPRPHDRLPLGRRARASAPAAARSPGSIAGGLLHVGPQSAGSTPGPACYGRGGTEPTVTDCCAGARLHRPRRSSSAARCALDVDAAARARSSSEVADQLGLELEEAAAAVLALATEKMVGAIEEITVNQGIDPRAAVLVGGGGAAGLNAVAVARRLGCRERGDPRGRRGAERRRRA